MLTSCVLLRVYYFSYGKDKSIVGGSGLPLSPTLLYLGLPWLTGALVFSIQGVTTVIVVFICALGPIGRSTQCVKGNTGLPGSAAKWLLQSSPGDSWARRVETLKGHTCS